MDPLALLTLSDLLVNLSAGWLGSAIIIPIAIEKPKMRFLTLTINIILAIVAFGTSFLLRKAAGL